MTKHNDGGPAYPGEHSADAGTVKLLRGDTGIGMQDLSKLLSKHGGMSLWDHYAGQALANPAICTGTAHEYELRHWFGERGGIAKQEIVARQAHSYADAMIAERDKRMGKA